MYDEIQRPPFVRKSTEGGVHRGLIGHIDIDHEGRSDAFGQRRDAATKGFALIAESKLSPFSRQRLGNAPGDGVVVGDAHDEAAFSIHQVSHSLSPRSTVVPA